MPLQRFDAFSQDADAMYGEPDLVDIVNQPTTPQKTINTVTQPAAPTTAPVTTAAPTTRNTGADFLAQVNANPAYARHNTALNALSKFANFSGDTVSPEFRQLLDTPSYGNAESGDYTSNDLFSATPTYNQDFVDALQGYKFTPTSDVERSGYNITAPDGRSTVINWGDKSSSFDEALEVAIPAFLSSLTGGALAGPLLGGLSVAATPLTTGIATGAISGGVGAGIQGGNILEGILKGGLSAGVTHGVGAGVNAIAPGASEAVENTLLKMGVPERTAYDLANYTKPALTGAAKGLLKGDVLGGVTDALAGQVVADISPSLKLTPTQGLAVANYLRTGNETALLTSLGASLAKDAIKSVGTSLKNIDAGKGSSFDSGEGGESGDDSQEAEQVTITGDTSYGADPDTGMDYWYDSQEADQDLNKIIGTDNSAGAPQVEVTGDRLASESIDNELGFSNYTPPVPQVEVTGNKPVPESIDNEIGFSEYSPQVTVTGVTEKEDPSREAFDALWGTDVEKEKEATPPPQVVVTGDKLVPTPEEELPLDTRFTDEKYNVTPGTENNRVVVTGRVPDVERVEPAPREITAIQPPTEVDVGDYLDKLPEDILNTLPDIVAPTPAPAPAIAPAPAPAIAPAPAPAPKSDDKTKDFDDLLNALAPSQQQQVLSQVLSQIPGFDVESMNYSRRPQKQGASQQSQPSNQDQLFAMLRAMGFKG